MPLSAACPLYGLPHRALPVINQKHPLEYHNQLIQLNIFWIGSEFRDNYFWAGLATSVMTVLGLYLAVSAVAPNALVFSLRPRKVEFTTALAYKLHKLACGLALERFLHRLQASP